MKKSILLILFGIIQMAYLHAQQTVDITGQVKDVEFGEAIPGVNILVKGTTTGTITNVDGNYSITAPSDAILVFTFIGLESKEVAVNGQSIINVTLKSDYLALEEVVAIGYGTARKRDLTGSIVNVKGETLKSVPATNAVSGLQGKVAGLTVVNSGAAGSAPDVKIRGIGTINSSTAPLYVVDGVFVDNISFLNPNDIESIEVLKDASSLAIFGVQGANGVIIVTTTSAKEGKLNITYSGYEGIQKVNKSSYIDMADASEFTTLYNEFIKQDAIDNGNTEPETWEGRLSGKGTDWQDMVLQTAKIRNHGVTITNGTEKSKSLASFGYFKQEGVYKYDAYERFTLRLKNDYTFNNILKVGASAALTSEFRDGYTNQLTNAVHSLPTYAPYDFGEGTGDEYQYDQNGDLLKNSNFPGNPAEIFSNSPEIAQQVGNPLANIEMRKGNSESSAYRMISNAYAELQFLKDFSYRLAGSADIYLGQGSQYNPKYQVSSMQTARDNSFSRNTSKTRAYQVDNLVTYEKELGEHGIKALGGLTYRESTSDGFSASADSLSVVGPNADENLQMLKLWSDKNKTGMSDSYNRFTFISYLARINYSYKDKYLLNATYRHDGSSKFSPNNRWGHFGSVGAAWIISEEQFMENLAFIDFLKLRASYGKIGNDKIGNYKHISPVNPKGTQVKGPDGKIYYLPTIQYFADPDLHWEVVEGTDVGIEAYFLGNRLQMDLGYYNKATSDLLVNAPAPPNGAYSYSITNAGDMNNSGFEITMAWNDHIGELKYSVSANASFLKNKVTSLPNDRDIIAGDHVTKVGEPIASIYGYQQEGIYQDQNEIDNSPETKYGTVRPGDIKFKDTNNDGVIDPKDRTYQGNYLPDWTYGATLNLSYKGFDFAMDMNGVTGVKIYNDMLQPATWAQFNYHTNWLNRWTGPGTSNTMPIAANRATNFVPSSFFVHSGDYFRIRNIQLGYNLPKSWLNDISIASARIYINAQNPLTNTDYIGFTPEIKGSILQGGRDNSNSYPQPATYSIGLNVNF